MAAPVREPAEAASLSALTAVCASPPTIAAVRGGYVGSASWPSPGHLGSMPGRSAYYSLVVGAATYLGVVVQLRWGSFLLGMVVPAGVCAVALPALPSVLVGLSRASRTSP